VILVVQVFDLLLQGGNLLLEVVDVRLLSAVLGDQVSVLQVDSFPLLELTLDRANVHFESPIFFDAHVQKLGLAFVLHGELVELLQLLFRERLAFPRLYALLLQLHQLHAHLLVALPLLLKLHLLVPEGLLQVGHLFEVPLAFVHGCRLASLHLLLEKHVLF